MMNGTTTQVEAAEARKPNRTLMQILSMESEKVEWFANNAKVALFFLAWYIFSSLTSNTNKAILEVLALPMTLTETQFLFTSLYCFILIKVGTYQLEPMTKDLLKKVIPLSIGNILAHVLSQISIAFVPVSFTHTVKVIIKLLSAFEIITVNFKPIFNCLTSDWITYKFNLQHMPVYIIIILITLVSVFFFLCLRDRLNGQSQTHLLT